MTILECRKNEPVSELFPGEQFLPVVLAAKSLG
jgi:hypothetical protein